MKNIDSKPKAKWCSLAIRIQKVCATTLKYAQKYKLPLNLMAENNEMFLFFLYLNNKRRMEYL